MKNSIRVTRYPLQRQGCCGPSIQRSLVEQPPASGETFRVADITFALDPAVVEQLQAVTLAVGAQGYKLEGFPSGTCC